MTNDNKYIVYVYRNKINGKLYVGQTNNWSRRQYQHKWFDKNGKTAVLLIDRAIAKYGYDDNFECFVLEAFDNIDECNDAEVFWIQYLGSHFSTGNGYNIDWGGKHRIMSEETKRKISRSNKGRVSPNKGKKLSEEYKAKISQSSMGKPGTNTGKTFNDEWCDKISSSNVGQERLGCRRFSPAQEQEICLLYQEGNSTYKLAKQYKCFRPLITDILIRHNIPIIKPKRSSILNVKQQEEIYQQYLKLKDKKEVAKNFNITKHTIDNILAKFGILPKIKDIKPDTEQQIIKFYTIEKLPIRWISKKLCIDSDNIALLLVKNKISIRIDNGRKKFSSETEDQICQDYQNTTKNRSKLARKYGCKTNTMTAILRRNGVI